MTPGSGAASATSAFSAPGLTPGGASVDPPSWTAREELAWASPWELSDGASLLPAAAAAPEGGSSGPIGPRPLAASSTSDAVAAHESTEASQLTFQTARSNFGDSEGEEGGGGASEGGSFLEALFPPADAVRLPRQGLPRPAGGEGEAEEPPPSWGELERQLRGGAWPVPRLAPKARIQQQLQRARDPAWQELNSPGPWAGPETPAPARPPR